MSETPDLRQRSGGIRAGLPSASVAECSYVHDLAEPYAFGTAESDEAERIGRHLRRCPRCEQLIAEIRDAAAFLALSVPQFTPSPGAKAGLFARVAQGSQSETAFRPAVMVEPLPLPTPTLPSSRELLVPTRPPVRDIPPPVRLPPPGSRGWLPSWQTLATPLATVPLVLALGIVGLWGLNTQAKLNDRVAQLSAAQAQVAALNSQVESLNSSVASLNNVFEAKNASLQSFTMQPSDDATASNARGVVIPDAASNQALVQVSDLRGEQATYDIMAESANGTMVPLGVLTVNDEGDGVQTITLPAPITDFKSFHLKAKPSEGEAGTSDVVTRPDVLWAPIEGNLGQSLDTDAPALGSGS